MSHAALTARYRPQTFAQVAGQDTVKAILSRAALEQRIAPAYLFSGTRGVGKTTVARVFAKALNCRTAPTAEPCNQCSQCRSITVGNAVDVIEIDGASNRGIDDVRRLKEVVGYAPMEGGYKIFIIDEAHMLSREAFNALLKTLEEPPAQVTFIMATTEPHKFPATIISRCQQYVFKPLSENGLVAHLTRVLELEKVEFEASALHLIARRGAGSVRDSMSLLGQVLALGGGKLTQAEARNVLGLAGQEALLQLLESFQNGDGLNACRILRDMLDQGLDMGFFLRELSSLWRNLFILRHAGEAALDIIDVPRDEAKHYQKISHGFSLQHIHAAWQMTLEGQRRVLTSLEPALALELLLLNLAMLPKILSLEQISSLDRKAAASGDTVRSGGNVPLAIPAPGGIAAPASTEKSLSAKGLSSENLQQQVAVANNTTEIERRHSPLLGNGENAKPAQPLQIQDTGSKRDMNVSAAGIPLEADTLDEAAIQEAMAELSSLSGTPDGEAQLPPFSGRAQADQEPASGAGTDKNAQKQKQKTSLVTEGAAREPHACPDWETLFYYADTSPSWLIALLRRARGDWVEKRLRLIFEDPFGVARLENRLAREELDALLLAWCGGVPDIEVIVTATQRKSHDELKAEVMEHPLVKQVQTQLGAYFLDCGQIR